MRLLRTEDWTSPVRPVEREVLSVDADGDRPPVLFVAGPGLTAAVFAEHWLARVAARGFPAYALTPRKDGDLRSYAHDAVQVAAGLPRQAVLAGHGTGALIVAAALERYPARAVVLTAPVLDRWATVSAALRVNPAGAVPALAGGPLRLNRQQLGAAYRPDLRVRPLLSARRLPRPVGDPPVLVAGSPDDRVVPRASLDRTAARYGGAPLLFPGMAHDLMLDGNHAEPIDAICDWLDKETG